MTRFDTSNFEPGKLSERPAERTPLHWWQQALADIRNDGRISTWAHDVVSARAFYEPGEVPLAKRSAWFREAFDMALYGDDRATVGGWSPVECIRKSLMPFEKMLADPSRPRDKASLVQTLQELGNPNTPFLCRDKLIRIGEAMLAKRTREAP